tara:strand:- start:103 stop:711 length:609 start_codon:yes stop_codon:yes gene_type:complete
MAERQDMSSSDDAIGAGLQGLIDSLRKEVGDDGSFSPAPVHLWSPDRCVDIEMEIRRDGTWWHEGGQIRREKLVRLFATILRKDADGIYLVTPVEKVIVHVEDAPFIATRIERLDEGSGQTLVATTNVGEVFTIDADHPIRVETDEKTGEPSPYVEVRSGLEARISRPAFYDLVSWGELDESKTRLHVVSADETFDLGKVTA